MHIYFDGVDLSGADYNLTALSASMSLGSPRNVASQNTPHRPGGTAWLLGDEPRQISVQAALWAGDGEEFRVRQDRLLNTLYAADLKSLRLDWLYPDRYWLVRLQNATPVSAFRQGLFAQFQLDFLAPDPYAFSLTEFDNTYTIDSDPYEFVLKEDTSPATPVGGSAPARPVYTITNTGSQITGVTIENENTGDALTWSGTLLQDDMIRIDVDRQLIEKSTSGGATWSTVMYALNTGHVFPVLQALAVNEMSITGIDSGTIQVVYRDRYL